MRAIPFAALALITVTAATGCATKKNFYAMGGSRADGTIEMAYDFAQFERPVVNMGQAQSIARSKCQVWGYQDADAFGGQRQVCSQFNGYGTCVAGQIVIQYQCIGSGNQSAPVSSFTPPPAQTTPSSSLAPGAISREQWKQQQLDQLGRETGLGYEEYMRRYKAIMAQ